MFLETFVIYGNIETNINQCSMKTINDINVVKTIINYPFGIRLYHLFMVMTGDGL